MSMGMPALYIAGLICGIIGTICQGVVTYYWSNLDTPACYLYSPTASSKIFYSFGSSVAVCNWVTYGSVVAICIAFITGLLYTIKVRGEKDLNLYMTLVLIGIVVSCLLILATTCTVAEGMRVTCTSMGLNSANNKGSNCYDKLNQRVSQYNLPIKTSTLVITTIIGLSLCNIFFDIIAFFHIVDWYRRYRRVTTERVDYK
ncbi:hypothetical protein Pmani_013799 [Petrolisthes manimaculis]|uniref:Uncharacterized protein n=1 Tax=Petrolisthes manimaculis TaxID=1843537 RepID=A0AAE1UD87_9EUCA|nr:hypothetical protein Pmani_013799 [Petrolisthes manimaculis]